MSENLATGDLAIAVCDRCHQKRPYLMLGPDGDKPGLRVCQDKGIRGCSDQKDPWRLPPRQPEPIALRYPRPDTDIGTGVQNPPADASVHVGNNPFYVEQGLQSLTPE
jgi:hypothetical protein